MSLTTDEIAAMEKAAERLDQFVKMLGRESPDKVGGCYVLLLLDYETHIMHAIDILLQKEPKLGESIKADCDVLLEKADSLSGMDEQDTSGFLEKRPALHMLARRIIGRFRRLAYKAETTGKRGRKNKYTVEQLEKVQASHNKYYKEKGDSKAAWHKAAVEHGIKSGKAAEMACRRYLKQNK